MSGCFLAHTTPADGGKTWAPPKKSDRTELAGATVSATAPKEAAKAPVKPLKKVEPAVVKKAGAWHAIWGFFAGPWKEPALSPYDPNLAVIHPYVPSVDHVGYNWVDLINDSEMHYVVVQVCPTGDCEDDKDDGWVWLKVGHRPDATRRIIPTIIPPKGLLGFSNRARASLPYQPITATRREFKIRYRHCETNMWKNTRHDERLSWAGPFHVYKRVFLYNDDDKKIFIPQ